MAIPVSINTTVGVSLTLSDKAAAKTLELAAKRDNPDVLLRLTISGGGCSGFQYAFDFDDTVGDDDTVIEHAGARLVVDNMSAQLLQGAEVDFEESLQGSQFVVRNPNATSTCGCGSSFSV